MIEEFDNLINSSSNHIIVKSTKRGCVLKDKKTLMTYLLNLDEYEKIVSQSNKHILKKIVKKKSSNILDCTGGFARDSAIFSSIGNTVTLIENNPVVMRVLNDSISRIRSTAMKNIFSNITTKFGNCIDFIRTTSRRYDYIYLILCLM